MRRRAAVDAGHRRADRSLKDDASTGGVWPFAAVSFAYFGFAGLFSTYAPLWYASLGFSTFAIGSLVALQSATRLLPPYLWGATADRSGRREALLRVAVGGALVGAASLFVSPAFAWVAFSIALLSTCTAGVIPISEALLAHRVSRGGVLDVGRYGRVRVWGSIGFIAAVSAAGFALQALGTGRFPWLCCGMLAALLAATFAVPPSTEAAASAEAPHGAWTVLRRPVVAWFFAGCFLTVLAHTGLYAFYSLYLASLGYAPGTIGLLWSAGVVAEVVWFVTQGRFAGRLPLHGWLVAAALVSALRFALVAGFATLPVVLVAAQLLHAVTFAAQHAACIAVVSRHFPGRLRGRGQALYAILGYGVSGVVGGLGGGALSEAFGFASVFWAAAAVSLLGAGACARALRLETASPSS